MNNQKKTGAYYTPETLADFVIKHVCQNYLLGTKVKVLEPSCGDGRFLKPLLYEDCFQNKLLQIDAVEINKKELKIALELKKSVTDKNWTISDYNQSFLDFPGTGYDLIIGNPPYINKKNIESDELEKIKAICTELVPDFGEVKNIWPAFLLKSITLLNDNGLLCFILPTEILQVKYTKSIRNFILSNFERVEIFAFNELVFPKIEQDVIILIGIKKVSENIKKGVSFFQVEKLSDLKIPDYVEKHSNVHRKKLDKWTNYILQDEELDLIEGLVSKLKMKKISEYCDKIEVGIVTAANDYFIVNNNRLQEIGLIDYAKPIIKRGSYLQNLLSFKSRDLEILDQKEAPIYFIEFPNSPKNTLSESALNYISYGEKQKLHERYKMVRREHWYNVPSVRIADGMFLKRSHLFPRIIVNQAQVLNTDSLYRIFVKDEFDIGNIAFGFFNTLTFILTELEGRYYGGGVLELTPNEFKRICIPYTQIKKENLKTLEELLRSNCSPKELLDYTDSILLSNLQKNTRLRLREIRNRLLNRRLKIKTSDLK